MLSKKIIFLKREGRTDVSDFVENSLTTVFIVKKNITFNLGSKSLNRQIRLLFCPIKETYSYDYSSIYLI